MSSFGFWGFDYVSPPQRRQWQPTPVFLPGESQGRGCLLGCRLRGHTESDMTEQLHFHFSLSCIGEGNGNPLPCSCLENPRDGGAWWAVIYGVAQSQTRLKRFSSNSIFNHILFSWLVFSTRETKILTTLSPHPFPFTYDSICDSLLLPSWAWIVMSLCLLPCWFSPKFTPMTVSRPSSCQIQRTVRGPLLSWLLWSTWYHSSQSP